MSGEDVSAAAKTPSRSPGAIRPHVSGRNVTISSHWKRPTKTAGPHTDSRLRGVCFAPLTPYLIVSYRAGRTTKCLIIDGIAFLDGQAATRARPSVSAKSSRDRRSDGDRLSRGEYAPIVAGTPFVGREPELASLKELRLRATRERSATAVVVFGDPGSGKSRLLEEAAREAGQRLAMVGFEPERRIPLAAARPALRLLARVPEHGPRLDALVAGAGEVRSGSLGVFEAALAAMAGLGPVLLTVDDLQWADETSVALCHYLVRAANAEGLPLALMAVSRPHPESRVFAEALHRLLPEPERVREIELGPLPRDAGVRLARALEPSIDAEAAAALWERAQGSPFWLGMLMATTERRSDLGSQIALRLQGAGSDASALLTLITLVGRPLTVREAAGMLGWPPRRTEAAAGQLADRGLGVGTGESVRVAHDLIRDIADRQIPEGERRDTHRRIAAWLEREAGDDLSLLLEALEHRRAGGLASEEITAKLVRSPRRRLLGGAGLKRLAAIADAETASSPSQLEAQVGIAELAVEVGDDRTALARWSVLTERLPQPEERRGQPWRPQALPSGSVAPRRRGRCLIRPARSPPMTQPSPWRSTPEKPRSSCSSRDGPSRLTRSRRRRSPERGNLPRRAAGLMRLARKRVART
jgi:hypothetical protein